MPQRLPAANIKKTIATREQLISLFEYIFSSEIEIGFFHSARSGMRLRLGKG
jgi:hypothetical protein